MRLLIAAALLLTFSTGAFAERKIELIRGTEVETVIMPGKELTPPPEVLREFHAIPPGYRNTEKSFSVFAADGRMIIHIDYESKKISIGGDPSESAKKMLRFLEVAMQDAKTFRRRR